MSESSEISNADGTDQLSQLVQLPVVYEDDCLIVIHKPTGMFVHRSAEDRSETNFVLQIVRDMVGGFVFPVHRLDRATSGILLLAKSREVAALLSQMFANRLVSKTYEALVRGHCGERGVIEVPMISARGRDKPKGHPFREPQEAVTTFERQERYDIPMMSDRYPTTRCSLISAQPLTGRYHQIRRHCNYISHPIIGDSSHGDSRQNRFYTANFNCQRMMLAAVKVRLQHPVADETLEIVCPPNESFTAVLNHLQQYRCD